MIKLAFGVFIAGIGLVVIKPVLIHKLCAIEARSYTDQILFDLNLDVPYRDDDIVLGNAEANGWKCIWR